MSETLYHVFETSGDATILVCEVLSPNRRLAIDFISHQHAWARAESDSLTPDEQAAVDAGVVGYYADDPIQDITHHREYLGVRSDE